MHLDIGQALRPSNLVNLFNPTPSNINDSIIGICSPTFTLRNALDDCISPLNCLLFILEGYVVGPQLIWWTRLDGERERPVLHRGDMGDEDVPEVDETTTLAVCARFIIGKLLL